MLSFKCFKEHFRAFFSLQLPSDVSTNGHNIREQLARRHLFEGLQNFMENKSERNENKIILGNLNCTMNKMERDGGNKIQRF